MRWRKRVNIKLAQNMLESPHTPGDLDKGSRKEMEFAISLEHRVKLWKARRKEARQRVRCEAADTLRCSVATPLWNALQCPDATGALALCALALPVTESSYSIYDALLPSSFKPVISPDCEYLDGKDPWIFSIIPGT